VLKAGGAELEDQLPQPLKRGGSVWRTDAESHELTR
jgi:hypothetical protein